MRSTIECCHYCKPPKRYPGCHDHCPEYAEEKAKNDEKKAAEDRKKAISYGITVQRTAGVNKALKRRRKINYVGKGGY